MSTTNTDMNYTATDDNIDKLYDIIFEKQMRYTMFFNQLNIHRKNDDRYRRIMQEILTNNNITNYLELEKKLFEAMFKELREEEKVWNEMFIKGRICDDNSVADY
jgi:hypothetical protein